MKRKILSILVALVLVLSFTLVMAVPAMAAALTVTDSLPLNVAVDVAVDTDIEVTFDRNLAELDFDLITLVGDSEGAHTFAVTILNDVMTINPTDNLTYGDVYTLTIPVGAVKSTDNLIMVADYEMSFTTDALTVTTVPDDLDTGVAVDADIVATFDGDVEMQGADPHGITLVDSSDVEVAITVVEVAGEVTITPSADLLYGEVYTLTIPTTAVKRAADDVEMAEDYEISFTTDFLDVTGTVPDDEETDVVVDTTIVVTFDRNVADIDFDLITMADSADADVPVVAAITALDEITVTPADNLLYGEEYTLTIPVESVEADGTGVLMAEDYEMSFTTDALTVTTVPDDAAVDVAVDADIVATFDGAVTELDFSLITLLDSDDNPVVIDVTALAEVVTIDPDGDLLYGEVYTLTIPTTAVKRTAGDVEMAADYVISFTTEGMAVTLTDPADGDTGVAVATPITVTFSRNVLELNFALITLVDSADEEVEVDVAIPGGAVLTVTPTADLDYGEEYTLTIPVGAVKSTDNLLMAADYEMSFTTDASGFTITDPGEQGASTAFDLDITGATDVDGEPIDGPAIAVTVTSDLDGPVFGDDVEFIDGAAAVPDIELDTVGTHTLTVEVAGVTLPVEVEVEVSDQLSAFIVDDPGPQQAGTEFNLDISGATDANDLPIDGAAIAVTVTSDIEGEVFNDDVEFTAGAATVPVTLDLIVAHDLTVTVEGVTDVVVVEGVNVYDTLLDLNDGWTLVSTDNYILTTGDNSSAWEGTPTLIYSYDAAEGYAEYGEDPDSAFDVLAPVEALYVKMPGGGFVGLNYSDTLPSPSSKDLYEGWNLVSSATVDNAAAVFAALRYVLVGPFGGQQAVGLASIVAQGIYNTIGGSNFNNPALTDAHWITLEGVNLSPFDGYWVYMYADATFSVIPD